MPIPECALAERVRALAVPGTGVPIFGCAKTVAYKGSVTDPAVGLELTLEVTASN